MSRFSRFVSGVSASYIGVGASIAYSLAIVPIGLAYLGVDQFGLWMLLTQIAGYLTLIEMGVFSSAARILIDHKDHKAGAAYAGVVATGTLLLVAQGILIACVCWILAPLVAAAFNIPAELEDAAIYIFIFLGISTGLATCFKIFSAILYANQRIDLVVLLTALRLILSLAIVWPLLALGYGLQALPWSFLGPVIIVNILSWSACCRLRLLPPTIRSSDIRMSGFRELFKLGADFFLVNVGTQLLEASQLMIVSRTMGLTAAATWSVSTKLFTLLFQLIARVENTAVVFFSEMIVRDEQEKLQSSFQKMYQFTGGLAVCGMLAAVSVNPFFVAAWAGTEVLWPAINNWLMAALLMINLLLRCHTDLIMHTKKIGLLRFLFFFESIAFVAAALWAAPRFGFAGILIAAICCALIFRSVYAPHRTASYFGLSTFSVLWRWVRFLRFPILAMSFVAVLTPILVDPLASPTARAVASSAVAGTAAVSILYGFGLPSNLRRSLHKHIRSLFTRCSIAVLGRKSRS
jgi:O-antigen/teichoic acid export membrane protein